MLRKTKSAHLSTWSLVILKQLSNLISPILCHIVYKSFTSGYFPNFLKIALVVPILKSGGATDVNKYISIIHIIDIYLLYQLLLSPYELFLYSAEFLEK